MMRLCNRCSNFAHEDNVEEVGERYFHATCPENAQERFFEFVLDALESLAGAIKYQRKPEVAWQFADSVEDGIARLRSQIGGA